MALQAIPMINILSKLFVFSHKRSSKLTLVLPILYMAWSRPEHQPDSWCIKPSIRPSLINFISGPILSHVKWCGPISCPNIFEKEMHWRELNFHGPMVEMFMIQQMAPIWPMLRVRAKWKTHVDFFKLAWRFGVIIMPPKMPHGMSECSGPSVV